MPQFRQLSLAVAITAVLLLVLSSVASAHPWHRFGPRGFDNICIGNEDPNTFPGDLDCLTNDGRDKFLGKAGNDSLDGGDKRDLIRGGQGNDDILGGPRSDRLFGNRGDDDIAGEDGRDRILGGRGEDWIWGGPQRDRIKGGPGDDVIVVSDDDKRDWVSCGGGNDTVYYVKGQDRVAASCENKIDDPSGVFPTERS